MINPSLCGRLALGLPLLLAACTVGPDYIRPGVETPASFKEAPKGWKQAQPRSGEAIGDWWTIFHDRQLNDLVPLVAINNQNLKAYEAAYREAQAVVREARANLSPSVSASTSASRARSTDIVSTTQTGELSASWDIDLWGKVRRQIESDQASAEASAADLADLTLSAQAEVVTDYFQLRYQDSLSALMKRTVKEYERTLDITGNQYEAGTAAKSDVITAQTQLETTRASAIATEETRAQYEHAIALLIGRPPSELSIRAGALPQETPEVPTVLPSDLLERRPDITKAERTMQQQNALIGVAVAAYYPSISLSGTAGYSGTVPLFKAANALWSMAASGSETLFDGGTRTATVDAARATYDQAVANYRQTVLTAFQGVEDQLSNLRVLKRQAAAQAVAVTVSRQAVDISLNEYRSGTTTYSTVVTAQATALSNEQTALQIQSDKLVAVANLIKAVGGSVK